MTYRISPITTDGAECFRLANESGDLARTTNDGRPFVTKDRALADEALAYLNQSRLDPLARMKGSHRMKSIFGAW